MWTAVVSLLAISCGTAFGINQGAVAGFSTSIPCDLGRQVDAPFWIINNTVYDLFSIARSFPFIPIVNSYSSLNIPFVYLSIDDTVFQCAIFTGDQLELDTSIQLVVSPAGQMGSGDYRDIMINELVLDYRNVLILEDNVALTWFAGESCSSRQFQVRGYSLQSGSPVLLDSHVFNVSNANSLTVPSGTSNGGNVDYRLVSLNEDGTCSENKDVYYYRFSDSEPLERRVLNPNINSTVRYAIPQTTICTASLRFVAGNRGCPVHNSTDGRMVFQQCTRGYSADMLKPVLTVSGEVCFFNVNPSSVANGSLYHFLCSTDPCTSEEVCLLRTVISTHMVLFSGPPSEPNITYNGSSLCFSAHYSHEEFPVENFTIGITDITAVPVDLPGTYSTRGPQCLSISFDPIPDLCLPFQATVAAINAIGRNSITTKFSPEQARIDVTVKTAESATLMLTCDQNNIATHLNYVLENEDTQEEETMIMIECGGSYDVDRLSAVTDYLVFRRFGDTYCRVNNFTTSESLESSESTATMSTVVSTTAMPNTVGRSKGEAVRGLIGPVIAGVLLIFLGTNLNL